MLNNLGREIIFIVIPNKNGKKHLEYSIPSLMNTDFENIHIIVADDGSQDGSSEFLQQKYPTIIRITNNGKKGFAGNVNTGIRYAMEQGADYIAICNNDIKVNPNWIECLISVAVKYKNVGLIGITEVLKENEDIFITSSVTKDNVECYDVKELPGCAYLCKTEVFRKIGLLDEDYFMYGEDNDLFYRLIRNGFKILKTNVLVWHFGEGSSQKNLIVPTWFAYRNALNCSIKKESGVGVIRMIMSLLNQGCNPFRRYKINDPVYKRMKRYNPLFNFVLIIGSIVWNLYHLPETIKQRKEMKKVLSKIKCQP